MPGAELRIDARAEDPRDRLFEAWSNLYRRFAVAMDATDRGDAQLLADFWYPDVHAGVAGVQWVERCVASADAGATWVDYE